MNEGTIPITPALSPALRGGEGEAASPREPWMPTTEDHEAGFKDLVIEHRSGKTEILRIKSPPTREVRAAARVMMEGGDFYGAVLALALPKDMAPGFMDKLTLTSVTQIESVALELSIGKGTVDKMQAAMDRAASAEPGPSEPPAPAVEKPQEEPAPAAAVVAGPDETQLVD